MAEYTLQAEPPLAGTEMEIAGVRLWAPADLALVSLAVRAIATPPFPLEHLSRSDGP